MFLLLDACVMFLYVNILCFFSPSLVLYVPAFAVKTSGFVKAIDNGDIEGFQKLSKVSEGLRKSAKFTAQQNKEGKADYVDSIGELVRICEKDGFIPRFATDIPQDKVDLTLQDMQGYLYKLVTQDLGFGQQIEDSLKKIMIQKEMNDAADQDIDLELQDEDFEAYIEEAERQKDLDAETMAGEWEEE